MLREPYQLSKGRRQEFVCITTRQLQPNGLPSSQTCKPNSCQEADQDASSLMLREHLALGWLNGSTKKDFEFQTFLKKGHASIIQAKKMLDGVKLACHLSPSATPASFYIPCDLVTVLFEQNRDSNQIQAIQSSLKPQPAVKRTKTANAAKRTRTLVQFRVLVRILGHPNHRSQAAQRVANSPQELKGALGISYLRIRLVHV